MLHSQSSRVGTILLLLAAVIGFAVALYAWWTPLTGVTDTIGALGVAIASVVLAGIGFAAALLHQYIITAAMVVGLIGLIMLSSHSARYNHSVRT